MNKSEQKHWEKVKPEKTSTLIAWLEDKAVVNKPYNLNKIQLEKIKEMWPILTLSDFEYSLNDNHTKIIKRSK